MSGSRSRWVLLAAGAWNVLGGGSALLDPGGHFRKLYTGALTLGDPLQLFFFRCTWINVIAWGAAYLLAAWLPASRRAVMAAGGAGKLAYVAACVVLFSNGVARTMLLATAAVDLVLAALFTVALLAEQPRPAA